MQVIHNYRKNRLYDHLHLYEVGHLQYAGFPYDYCMKVEEEEESDFVKGAITDFRQLTWLHNYNFLRRCMNKVLFFVAYTQF